MQYEYEDEDFEQTGGGKWIRLIGITAYMLIIIAFAWQTLELVGWLFPKENWFMKAVTVFVCDGCATLYAMAEMFYRFRLRWSKNLIFGMWLVAFLFSTGATVVQLYLSSIDRVPHQIDPGITTIAYAIIIFAFVVNIIAITSVIRMEYNAAQPKRLYQDDKEYRKRRSVQRVRVVEQAPVRALAPAQAAHTRQKVDPHKVRPQIESEKKSIEPKESILDKLHTGIEKVFFKGDSGVADGELESPVDYDEEERIDTADEKPILETKPDGSRTRRYGGDPDLEAQEDEELETESDLMALPIDDRWKEYTTINAETPAPQKKRGRKKARQED
jgi:hypothetical protein